MNFNEHWNLEGRHAFLSPSQYHWLNYSEEKLRERYSNYTAAERGTRLHAFAAECVELGVKLARTKSTLNMFVNDAIGYKMTPEQPLYFSDNCFGTADAISFRKNLLRVHDLKTGVTPASMMQLEVYAAIFCLEYGYDPHDIDIELRIYQSNEVLIEEPDAEDILGIMRTIERFDKCIEELKEE